MLSLPSLSPATLSNDDATSSPECGGTVLHSPNRHPFMRRVATSRFTFDPYKAVRTPPRKKSPEKSQQSAAPAASCVGDVEGQAVQETPIPNDAALPRYRVVTVPSNVPRYALVAFKQTTGVFLAPFKIAVDDLVVTDGDRGEHIGAVREITTEPPLEEVTVRVLRRATVADKEACVSKANKEREALEDISRIAREVRLAATVVDVEYQFDMNKITIFVERASESTFVDFRKLQRTLYRQYHCRIWCTYMDEIKDGVVVNAKARAPRKSEASSSAESVPIGECEISGLSVSFENDGIVKKMPEDLRS